MTDVRKVISALNTPGMTSATNYCKAPEGDRPVFYNRAGQLDTDYPLVMSAVKSNQAITSLALSQANTTTQFVGGTLYSTNGGTFAANDLTPYRVMIVANGAPAGDFTLTFPSPAVHIGYLKTLLGAENVTAGLYFKIVFMNATTSGHDWNFSVTVPPVVAGATQTVSCIGFRGAGPFTFQLEAGDDNNRIQTCCATLHFLITSVTPANEGIVYFFQP